MQTSQSRAEPGLAFFVPFLLIDPGFLFCVKIYFHVLWLCQPVMRIKIANKLIVKND
ncbi:hypothetical protein Q7C_907 [Methylophaga frappieri]|uniref:Uncharacterized protein n=1 Tax=Methylophaga frappieri (strain ATCC BAA-2434 / DSM 25690 / JAM7) TaxID=754477 RepID=I1YGN3_METFJ|nr:hypothetical protein Q7C_907 [Methylophaga frappieri]